MEQFKFNAGDYLKRQLGMSEQSEKPKLPEQEKKEVVEAMTIGRMEEFRELLNNIDMETFLGQREGGYSHEKEKIKKGQELIKEFLSAKDGLDSNSKEKLYNHILEENWKPKLERVFDKISEELKGLEILRDGRDKDYQSLSDEEMKIYMHLLLHATKTGLARQIDAELKKLEEFGFDEQRLNGLKEQLRALKRPPKKA